MQALNHGALNHGFLCIIIGTQNYSGYAEVFVSRTGNDSGNCGQLSKPCKSIALAVKQVEWSGHIYLDGTGT